MSESIKHEMERSFDRIEPDPGAKERMLANVRRKAAEPVPDTGKTETPLVESSYKSNKLLRFGLPVAACLVLGVIGVIAIPRSPQPIGESDETVLNSQEETPVESQTVHVEVPTTPNSPNTSKTVTIPAPEMGSKPRLSDMSAEELIRYLLENGQTYLGELDAEGLARAKEMIRESVRRMEEEPYLLTAASAKELLYRAEKQRQIVCGYYGWPLARLIMELNTDVGSVDPEFQLWTIPEAFYNLAFSATGTGMKMTLVSPSVRPDSEDFRRKMTVYLEPADVIREKEKAEDSGKMLKAGLGEGIFPDGTAVIYDLGNHAYDVYLYLEGGRSAVKIETSLTEEELTDLLKNCRLFETAG